MSYSRAYHRLTADEDIITEESRSKTLNLASFQPPPYKIAPPSNKLGSPGETNHRASFFGSVEKALYVPRPILKPSFFNSRNTVKDLAKIFEDINLRFRSAESCCDGDLDPYENMCDNQLSYCDVDGEVTHAIEKTIEEDSIMKHKENGLAGMCHNQQNNSTPRLQLSKDTKVDNNKSEGQGMKSPTFKHMGGKIPTEITDDGWETISTDDAVEEFVLVDHISQT